MNFLRSATGLTRPNKKDLRITDELNILNLNNTIIESRSHWKYHVQRIEDRPIPKKINIQHPTPEKKKK
jgi:hypothetical protein